MTVKELVGASTKKLVRITDVIGNTLFKGNIDALYDSEDVLTHVVRSFREHNDTLIIKVDAINTYYTVDNIFCAVVCTNGDNIETSDVGISLYSTKEEAEEHITEKAIELQESSGNNVKIVRINDGIKITNIDNDYVWRTYRLIEGAQRLV